MTPDLAGRLRGHALLVVFCVALWKLWPLLPGPIAVGFAIALLITAAKRFPTTALWLFIIFGSAIGSGRRYRRW